MHQRIIFQGEKRSNFSHLLTVRLGAVNPVIDSQIQSPKFGNNFIVPLNLDADWSSPDDPARVLVFLSNLFVISIGDAFHSRCQCVSGERSNWCEEGGIKLSIQTNIVKSRKHVIWNTSVI